MCGLTAIILCEPAAAAIIGKTVASATPIVYLFIEHKQQPAGLFIYNCSRGSMVFLPAPPTLQAPDPSTGRQQPRSEPLHLLFRTGVSFHLTTRLTLVGDTFICVVNTGGFVILGPMVCLATAADGCDVRWPVWLKSRNQIKTGPQNRMD